MSQQILDHVEKSYLKSETPSLRIGDTVDVLTRIREGDKERTQTYTGVLIAVRGHGINTNFTVRRIVGKEGVERTFMLHSPNVISVESKRRGKVRRAKLFFLRDRVGKARRLKEVRTGRKAKASRKGQGSDAEGGQGAELVSAGQE